MRNIKMSKIELSNKQLKTLALRQHYIIIGIAFIIVFSVVTFNTLRKFDWNQSQYQKTYYEVQRIN